MAGRKGVAGREAKGGFNFGQVVLKRALLWNKMPSIMKVCHPSSFKTKVMVFSPLVSIGFIRFFM